jgi:hypothetical protein
MDRFCFCGKKVTKKWGFWVCEDHFNDIKPREPKKRIKKYSGRMGKKHKKLLKGLD